MARAQKVAKVGVKKENGYLYFVDKDGDIAKVLMARGGQKKKKKAVKKKVVKKKAVKKKVVKKKAVKKKVVKKAVKKKPTKKKVSKKKR